MFSLVIASPFLVVCLWVSMLNEVNGQFRLSVWKLILRVCTFDNKMGGTLVERFCFTVLGWKFGTCLNLLA